MEESSAAQREIAGYERELTSSIFCVFWCQSSSPLAERAARGLGAGEAACPHLVHELDVVLDYRHEQLLRLLRRRWSGGWVLMSGAAGGREGAPGWPSRRPRLLARVPFGQSSETPLLHTRLLVRGSLTFRLGVEIRVVRALPLVPHRLILRGEEKKSVLRSSRRGGRRYSPSPPARAGASASHPRPTSCCRGSPRGPPGARQRVAPSLPLFSPTPRPRGLPSRQRRGRGREARGGARRGSGGARRGRGGDD